MPVTKKSCKHHPDQLTTRRCFHCKDYICHACQYPVNGHIFCGYYCYLKWKWAQISKRIPVSTELRIFIVLILITNLVNWLLFNRLSDQLTHPDGSHITGTVTDRSEKLYFELDTVRQMVSSEIKISMQLNPGFLVGLERNGRFVDSRISETGAVDFGHQYLEQGENPFSIWILNKEGKSSRVDSFCITFSSPRLDYLKSSVTHIPNTGKVLALTFDGGSLRDGSEELLDVLDSLKLRCTMFLTGRFIANNPDLVHRMLDSGHEIGNHTYSHPHLTNLEIDGSNHTREDMTREILSRQLDKADSMLYKTVQRHMSPYWRAPYGEINNSILFWAAERGYKHIGWSSRCDAWDWVSDTSSNLYRTNTQMVEHFLNLEKQNGLNGTIILMHLGTERNSSYLYEVLPELVATLRSRGYLFKRISELMKETKVSGRPLAAP